MGKLIYYKCTRAGGVAFYDAETRYKPGETLIHSDPEQSNAPCGRGYHCSPTPQQAARYASGDLRSAEFYEVEFDEAAILGRDDSKVRVSVLTVREEVVARDFGIIRGRLDQVLGSGTGSGFGDGFGP